MATTKLDLSKLDNATRKPNWTIVAIFVPVIMCVMGWVYSLESRIATLSSTTDLSNRVKIIEELITPLVIEHKVSEKLKELGVQLNESSGRYVWRDKTDKNKPGERGGERRGEEDGGFVGGFDGGLGDGFSLAPIPSPPPPNYIPPSESPSKPPVRPPSDEPVPNIDDIRKAATEEIRSQMSL